MSGLTPIKEQQAWPTTNDGVTILTGDGEANGVLTISTGDGQVSTFVRPNRMDYLPDDVIQAIFTRLVTTRDFSAFSETCSRMYTISCNIPVYAFPSGSLRDFAFIHNTELKGAAIQLIQTVGKERWTSFRAGNKVYLRNPSPDLQKTQNTFYLTFTRCCFQLNTNIDCGEFFGHYLTAFWSVEKICKKICSEEMHFTRVKVNAVFLRLHDRVYGDIINISTDQLNESITFQTFKSSVEHIRELFDEKSVIDIEADLRNALRTKYGTAFQTYASECLNAFPISTIVAEMELQLKTPLEAEKAAIEAELAILRGPNHFNGTINDAYMEMEALMNMQDEPRDQARLNAAYVAFLEVWDKEAIGINSSIPGLCCSPSYNLRRAHAELEEANQSPSVLKRNAAKTKFDELVARLSTLAQWEEGTDILIGGKLFEVCNKLEDIGFISLFKVRQRGQFYAELACPVTEENKQVRFDFLLKCSYS